MFALAALLLFAASPAAPPIALTDDAAAEVEYDRIRDQFGHEARPQSVAALAALTARHPASPAAGRALLWMGDLAARDHVYDDAERHYSEARRRFPVGEMGALALRGLGDTALARGRFTEAIPLYEAALVGAPRVLAIELQQKRAIAFESRRRFGFEIIAWLLFCGAILYFARRLLQPGVALHWPTEVKFMAPLYLLLVVACWGRDEGVRHALYWLALGSLGLVTLAFLPAVRRRLTVDGALLTLGNLALFYIAIRRAGIVDVLWTTLKAGADAE